MGYTPKGEHPLYATIEGIGSARAVAWLCANHHGFRWLCGGVEVNYHTLADFRVAHLDFLDELLTHSVAALMEQDLVDINRVAQDGLRVRASAGVASFRRRPTLERCLQDAQTQVQRLRDEVATDPGEASRGQQKARERAAREREEQIRKALLLLPEMEGCIGILPMMSAEEGRQQGESPGLDDRPRGPRHEDGRWLFPPGLQRPVQHRYGLADHRRG